MTNDSRLFRTRRELEELEQAYPIAENRWGSPTGEWVPLYEGKMVQAYDHRAASIVMNLANPHRPAQPAAATLEQHRNPDWLPEPQYWVKASECGWPAGTSWVLGFKEITASTNERAFIAALFPTVAFGNKVPLLKPGTADRREFLLCGNLNSVVFDFVTRQKFRGKPSISLSLNSFPSSLLSDIPKSMSAIKRLERSYRKPCWSLPTRPTIWRPSPAI